MINRKPVINKASKQRMPYKSPLKWTGKMKNIPVFLLGNGPSIEDDDVSILQDKYFTIGSNRIFYIYDPTILLWQDLALWIQEEKKILATRSIKYVRENAETKGGFFSFKLQGRDPKVPPNTETLFGRGSTGSLCYQLAWALGCNPIFLVGMDCKYRGNEKTDFYGKNAMHKPHTLIKCTEGLRFIRDNAHDRTIVNCSDSTIFKDRISLAEAIKLCGDKTYTREELVSLLIE